jgi:hypothetical protein
LGQPTNVDWVGLQQVKSYALCALWANAWQPSELVDEVLNYTLVHLWSTDPI